MLVFEVGRLNHFDKRIAEEIGIFAVVKTEAHFVKIGREMLRRDFMPRAHDAALEQAESGFHGVCMHVAVGIFPRVIDGLVKIFLHLVKRPWVDGRFISHNHFDVRADVGVDNLANGGGLRILGVNHAQITVALPNADDNLLVTLWTPAALLAAYVGLINLDCAAEFLWSHFQHCSTDSVTQMPSGLIASVEIALELIRGDTFFGFAHEVGSGKPFRQRQVGVVKDSSRSYGELVAA